MYYLKKKVDCLNFEICHRREDLTTKKKIVLTLVIYCSFISDLQIYMVCYTFFLK
jgi:hypothetical protein